MAERYDIIIFGATGYTGRYVIEQLAKANKTIKKTWAVAGRNTEKVKASLEAVQQYLDDIDIMQTPIIEADVSDEDSISNMCKKAKLILNCVGPYKLYGQVVVEACIRHGTHHVDISGEMKYLETTQVKYFNEAKEKGIYLVQACGFDSIPADFGIALLKSKFPGDMNSVEYYVHIIPGQEDQVLNTGTYMSAVYSIVDHLKEKYYSSQWRQIFTKELPKSFYPLTKRLPLFFSDVVKGWCIWFMGPDERVIKRSQYFAYEFLNERPVQVNGYMQLASFIKCLLYMLFLGWFGFLALFPPGQYLLGKFPSFFSGGLFSKDGPTRKQVEECKTKITLCAKGWKERLAEPTDQHQDPPDEKMTLVVTGPEPAYPLTATCMVHSGLVILDEPDKMPLTGGVLTPGVAFAKTTLRERLEKHGIKFEFQN